MKESTRTRERERKKRDPEQYRREKRESDAGWLQAKRKDIEVIVYEVLQG
jgi:hypothetical protein